MAKFVVHQEIYTFQIDYSRHVSNVIYIQWMEIARLKLIEAAGMAAHDLGAGGIVPVLVETSIAYKKPLFLGDKVRIEVWISDLARASAVMEFRFYNQNNDLAASASQKGLFMELESGRPIRLTPEQRTLFEPFLGD
ncbi:MAG: acyl-CoA thioesterase [Candidatus Sumerlaeaceae bacterium]|nr:acyl-CoA thioesterase [Candidatus Sumerlaeaceae bacterium]